MTSISFATNAFHLTTWGLSLGDIAVLTGAGRGIITWLTADARDNNLLEFLEIAEKELCFRKGVVDPVALNARWSKTITLLQNGQRVDHQPLGDTPGLVNVCRFTWIMTLIVAALDACVSNSSLESIVVEYTSQLFAEETIKMKDYLKYEIPDHISGWRSAATTRNIIPRAKSAWAQLENQPNHHLPGFIPSNDSGEIVRFLLWLTSDSTPKFPTSSSDLHSLATVLCNIGFDTLRVDDAENSTDVGADESNCLLVFRTDGLIGTDWNINTSAEPRRGMRVPLRRMQETMSLWPEPPETHNKLRLIFENAQNAASELHIFACPSPFGNRDLDPGFRVVSRGVTETGRLSSEVFRLVDTFLLLDSPEACNCLSELVSDWSAEGLAYVMTYLELHKLLKAPTTGSMVMIPWQSHDRAKERYMVQLRAFLLGYYYGAFGKILDVSQLRTQEGFGSWGWNNREFFRFVADLVKSQISRDLPGKLYWRFQFMRMVAYLFAGAEATSLNLLKHGSAGIIAKLVVLVPGVLGEADTPQKISKLHLLDVDSATIPSNQRGIIMSGGQARCMRRERNFDEAFPAVPSIEAANSDPDFTTHIEPAWGFDTSLCLVAYRYKGRLIHKVNPLEAEAAILEWWSGNLESVGETSPEHAISVDDFAELSASVADNANSSASRCFAVLPSHFEGGQIQLTGNVVVADAPTGVCLVASAQKPKARTCIAAMYHDTFTDRRTRMLNVPWSRLSDEAVVMQTQASMLTVLL